MTILIVPGLGNSGPDHWQSWWQTVEPEAVRVEQEDWTSPNLAQWSASVANHLREAASPVWIVAHSFGCLAAVAAAVREPDPVAGAFLVAPADPERFQATSLLHATSLIFPSLVVASSNDPWMKFMTAALWAERWGSRLAAAGAAGDLNAESDYGA